MSWHFRRFRPNAFLKDQKGTCRQCGQAIYFFFDPNSSSFLRQTRGSWLHEGITVENWEEQDHYPDPREFCCETVTTSDYDYCGSPVKYEDIRAENYACGRHMRKWEEEKASRERGRLERERRAQREKLEAYEVIQYHEAGEWIKEHFPTLIEAKYQAKQRWGSLRRTTDVDVFILKEFLEGVVERLATGVEEDEPPTEEWKDEIANRPPPPWVGRS